MKKDAPAQMPRGFGMPRPASLAGPRVKAKNFRHAIRQFGRYLRPSRIDLLLIVFLAILSTTLTLFGPRILGSITDHLATALANHTAIDRTLIARTCALLLALYAFSSLSSYLQQFILARVVMTLTYRLRNDVSKKINALPLKYFDSHPHGEILAVVTSDIETIAQNFHQALSHAISSLTLLIGILIMMMIISPLLSLVALIIIPLCLLAINYIIKRSQRHFIAQQAYLGQVNSQVEEVYGAHTIIKTYNQEEAARNAFNESNKKLFSAAWKAQFISSRMFPLIGFVGNLSYVLVCVVGGYFGMIGWNTIGDLQAFLTYVKQFNQPLVQTSSLASVLQAMAAASERLFAFLEAPEESETVTAELPEKLTGAIVFDDVTFSYQPGTPVIKNFSLSVQPGQRVALVGATGAGKTTIVKLLMRFYDLDSGAIYLDGVDLATVEKAALRHHLGMVLQDTWLFAGSIWDNIRFGDFAASPEKVLKSATDAKVNAFVQTLPSGYQLQIDENASNLSQGQKQLITIARAFLADPDILILDEATSSVDTRTELLIQEAMATLMEGRTTFIIAHRLSTIKNADWILVLDHGDIVEQGSHVQLLNKNGRYAQLYQQQFQNPLA